MSPLSRGRSRPVGADEERRCDPHLVEHQRLLAGEPDACERLAAALLREVTPVVHRIVRCPDRGGVEEAVDDAILDYVWRPGRFDPSRGTLINFIITAAVRNVWNFHRAAARRRTAEDEARRRTLLGQDAAALSSREWLEAALDTWCSPEDRKLARAWLDGAPMNERTAHAGPAGAAPGVPIEEVRRRIERLR